MELTPVNFFTHLILHPYDAETEKQQKIALITSIAIGVLTLFSVHLICFAWHHLFQKSDQSDESVNSTQQVAEQAVFPKKEIPVKMYPGQLKGTKSLGQLQLVIYQGDLLRQRVDAIVNPANTSLQGGGGVDGLIGKAAGRSIYQECKEQLEQEGIHICNIGDAYITGSGKLESRGIQHVIHAVGPRSSTNDGDRLLKAAYSNSLLRAHEKGLNSVAFPAISIGIFGFDARRAAEISYEAIREFANEHPTSSVNEVRLVYWTNQQDQASLLKMLSQIDS